MKRLISILTLLVTLGFALPVPVEAAKPKHRHKVIRVVKKQKPAVLVHSAAARHRDVRSFYSNRNAPVILARPAPQHPYRAPRRSSFNFLIRL